jgi:hypothetical protein
MANLKIKISVLWIFWILGFLIHMFLAVIIRNHDVGPIGNGFYVPYFKG